MGRAPCCDKANVKRGPWSPEEDATLKNYVESHGTGGNWIALPQKAGLKRCGKSCRLRWLNYLRPDIKHGGFTEEEDNIICTLYNQMGSRWSLIASQLPGRTDNDVKNYWNTKLKKKILAGKSSFNISNTNIIIPTQPAASSAAVLQPCLAKTEPYNLDYSTPQPHIPASSPILSDVGYGFSVSTFQNLGLEQAMHFAHSEAVPTLENNNTNSHNIVTSNSQEGSSVSDSTSLAMESKSVGSMAGNRSSYADDDSGCNILMDQFSYDQFPYEFVNDIWSQEKAAAGGVVPSYYDSTLADFSLADIKPQGVVNNQSVTNQY